ncbi:Zinc finger, SWIM-type [uncultured Caudovirales phage]|uniref:Zinc finger, SWIM-type n=1 Tax=uncultured Caudovirales phage TaxID=2100421 RepID=A0A6J5M2W6_9CAUD|nr:Zinc finger, SWIM-type [uncultured Caudovirales phage]
MSIPYMSNRSPQEAPPLPRREKALETTRLRATTLLSKDGYAVDTHPSLRPGLYVVTKPEATLDKTTGEVVEGYEVDLLAPSCTCKMFEFSRGVSCKHLLATMEHIAHCYNLLAPMLAESGLTIPSQLIPSAPQPAPIRFTTAPNPAPSKPVRAGRGIPYCQKCACVMVEATREQTGQEGHLCMACEAFQPLGSYGPLTRPGTGARP